jgi:hypothetical protein
MNKFSKAILWGHKLHSHTHSYIHNAFVIAFKAMGYETYWFDDSDDVSNFDFSNSLFITEGQVDKNIPIREDCFYVLHNCYEEKYKQLFDKNRCMALQVYTDSVLQCNFDKIDDCIYYDIPGKCLYMPWATDLLPHEIEANKPRFPFNKNSRIINWIGTVGAGEFGNIDQIEPFKMACEENEKVFYQTSGRSVQNNIQLIQESYIAPTIVGEWQHKVGYIPCRIFKNISYGQFGLTNSPRIYEVFQHKIVYNNDTYQLFYDAEAYVKNMQLSELCELIDFVKNKHTYINRINTILDFIEKVS